MNVYSHLGFHQFMFVFFQIAQLGPLWQPSVGTSVGSSVGSSVGPSVVSSVGTYVGPSVVALSADSDAKGK